MHTHEKPAARETKHRRGLSLFRSQSSTPRSASPRSFQLYELLHARRMHSFTRRMKSFNKDRNPDLALRLPSYMRQTCSSLIKRHSLCDQESNRCAKSSKSRRTTSMGAATPVHRKGTREQRRAYSSLEHARPHSMSFAPNDTLGFLLEEMPEGLSWDQSYGANDALDVPSSAHRGPQGERRRRHSTQHTHRSTSLPSSAFRLRRCSVAGHVSFDDTLTKSNDKVADAATVHTPKARPRGMDRKAGCSSRAGLKQVNRTSVDRKSDKANNTSSGNFEDVVPATERPRGGPKRRGARSAVPWNESDVASLVQNKLTSNKESKRRPTSHRKSKSQDNSRDLTAQLNFSPVQQPTQEPSMNDKTPMHYHEGPSAILTETENRMEEDINEAKEECSSIESDKVEDKAISAPEEEAGDSNEEIEEKVEGPDDDWRPMTYATPPADEIFPAAPVAVDADQFAKEIRSQESHEGYCDALSKSLQSSEDLASESNFESTPKAESRAKTESDARTDSEAESEAETEISVETDQAVAVPNAVRRRRRPFLRLRRRESPSQVEDTGNKQDSRPSHLMQSTGTRPSLASRLQCCRISFKACFCGADVSPGPESDDDDPDPAVYFSE